MKGKAPLFEMSSLSPGKSFKSRPRRPCQRLATIQTKSQTKFAIIKAAFSATISAARGVGQEGVADDNENILSRNLGGGVRVKRQIGSDKFSSVLDLPSHPTLLAAWVSCSSALDSSAAATRRGNESFHLDTLFTRRARRGNLVMLHAI